MQAQKTRFKLKAPFYFFSLSNFDTGWCFQAGVELAPPHLAHDAVGLGDVAFQQKHLPPLLSSPSGARFTTGSVGSKAERAKKRFSTEASVGLPRHHRWIYLFSRQPGKRDGHKREGVETRETLGTAFRRVRDEGVVGYRQWGGVAYTFPMVYPSAAPATPAPTMMTS